MGDGEFHQMVYKPLVYPLDLPKLIAVAMQPV